MKIIRQSIHELLDPLKWECRATCAPYALIDQHRVFERVFGPYCSGFNETRDERSVVRSDSSRANIARAHRTDLRKLSELGYRLPWIWNLSTRHFNALIGADAARGLGYHTLQDKLGMRRSLFLWVGKGQAVPRDNRGVIPPEVARTPHYAEVDDSWTLDVTEFASRLRDADAWVGHALEAQDLFGARVKESLCLDARRHDHGTVLQLSMGAKGGLLRIVPIETARQQEFLERMRCIYPAGPLFADATGQKLHVACERFHHVVDRRLGLTQAASGRTPRGLRQGYALRIWESVAFVPAPVRGGPWIAPALSDSAHGATSLVLGHGWQRTEAEYTGPVKVDRRRTVEPDHPGLTRAALIRALYEEFSPLRQSHLRRKRRRRPDQDPLGLEPIVKGRAKGARGKRAIGTRLATLLSAGQRHAPERAFKAIGLDETGGVAALRDASEALGEPAVPA